MQALNERKLRARFRGTLLGASVGDALGFPYKGYSRSFLRSMAGPITASFARHGSGFYPIGQTTEDTQTLQAAAEAVIEAGAFDGPTIAERLIPLWRDGLVVNRSPACTEVMEALVRRRAGWNGCALPVGRIENCCLSRALLAGMWDHDRPDALAADVEVATSITHVDPRAMGAAAALAAAVGHNLTADDVILGDFLDRAAAAAGRFHGGLSEAILDFPRILSQTEYRAFEIFSALTDSIAGGPRPEFEDGVTENAVQTVLSVFFFFLKSPFDYEGAVEGALRAGGDVETSAALTGALCGALLGSDAIPPSLAGTVLDAPAILDVVDRLFGRWWERRGPVEELPAAPSI